MSKSTYERLGISMPSSVSLRENQKIATLTRLTKRKMCLNLFMPYKSRLSLVQILQKIDDELDDENGLRLLA